MNDSFLLSILVENSKGVLNRIASTIRRRQFNIETICAGPTEQDNLTIINIQVKGKGKREQLKNQLNKIIETVQIDYFDINDKTVISKELLFLKIIFEPKQKEKLLKELENCEGKIINTDIKTVTIEIVSDSAKVDSIIKKLAPFKIVELSRSGIVALKK